jgi:AcrR family transcriptional regulator
MSKFQERLRKQREDEILAAAYQLLTERGYEGMTMDEVAAQVGISKVTLYQHFASKEALAAGIAVDQMRRIEQALEPHYHADGPALERLQAVLRYSLEQQAPKWAANLPPNARFVAQDPAFQALYAQRMAQWEQLVDQAKAEGSVDLQVSTAVLVRMMQQLFAPGYEDLVLRGRATPDEIIRTLLTVILRGALRAPPS